MVHYADVLPTLLHLATDDATQPASGQFEMDGKSFLDVLQGKTDEHRKYVYGIHNNVPEGPSYPIRTVSDGKYRYIRNLRPNEVYIEKHLMGWTGKEALKNPYWATWVASSWNKPHTYALVRRYMHRPAEQLYVTSTDPYEMKNLANNEEHQVIRERLAAELDRFLASQGDPGIAMDTLEALQAARKGKHTWD
jgi:uncharacterized sulfatase